VRRTGHRAENSAETGEKVCGTILELLRVMDSGLVICLCICYFRLRNDTNDELLISPRPDRLEIFYLILYEIKLLPRAIALLFSLKR